MELGEGCEVRVEVAAAHQLSLQPSQPLAWLMRMGSIVRLAETSLKRSHIASVTPFASLSNSVLVALRKATRVPAKAAPPVLESV